MPQIVGSTGEPLKINKIGSLNSQNALKNSLQFYFSTWLDATTIGVLNGPSFPFIVFDFDNIQFLFESSAPSKFTNFLNLLMKWKDQGCVVFSSPTTQGILKFKILLRVENMGNYELFQETVKKLQDFGIPVGNEDKGSDFGSHFRTFNLKNPKGFLNAGSLDLSKDPNYIRSSETGDVIYKDLLKDFVEMLTPKESKNLEKVFDSSRKDFKPLSEISNEIEIPLEEIKSKYLVFIQNQKFLLNEY